MSPIDPTSADGQHSDERAESVGEGCCRCGAEDLHPDSDFCPGCRAYLLGDSDVDPTVSARDEARAEAARFRSEMRRRAEASGDPLAGLFGYLDDLEATFVDRLAAGELFVLQEDGETVTGAEAVALVEGSRPA